MNRDEITFIIRKEIEQISGLNLNKPIEMCIEKKESFEKMGLCSLEVVQLLVELEEIFHIEFTDSIKTISEVVEYIKKHMEK